MITFNRFLKTLHLLVIRPIKLPILNAVDNLVFGGAPDAPPAPDYTGLAEQTAASDLEAARSATTANRPDQYTPYGSMTWTNLGTEQFDEDAYNAALDAYYQNTNTGTSIFTGNPITSSGEFGTANIGTSGLGEMPDRADFTTMVDQDKWRSDVNLSPEVQALFDKGLMMKDISADIGLQAGEQIKDIFSTPFELDDFEGYRKDVYDAMMERLETDIDKDWQSRNAELYASGIGRGTEAYSWEQMMRDRQLNDARLQAYKGATDQALRERGQTVKEALLQRQTPLNEFNAWRTGAQTELPTFQPGGQQRTTAGADYLGAGDMRAQYDLAGYNADMMNYMSSRGDWMDLAGDIMSMFKPT